MKDFKLRLLEEQKALSKKASALAFFIKESKKFKKLPTQQQALLKIQLPAMNMYLECLSQRIDLL